MNRLVRSLLFVAVFFQSELSAQTYCTPSVQMACFYGDKIVNVTFAGINHTDNVCDVDGDGQKDFTTTVTPAQVTAGNSYSISVGAENSFSTGTEYIRIWIDFNHNYTFEATESFDLGAGTGNTVLTATIAIPAGAVPGTTRMRVMYRRTNALNAGDACHAYGNYRGQMKDYAVTINSSSNCTSALTPGNTIASLSSACPGELFTLSLQNTVSGPTYQWQLSVNGTAWNNIPAATAATLTTSQSTSTYYRCQVTCGGNSGTSNPQLIGTNGPVYTTLPLNESFELWSNQCGQTNNVPGISWLTTPATGNNSFRRDDQGASAAWSPVSSGAYSPVASQGSHSARFHTAAATSTGTLDLYVNCSTGPAEKVLTFDYINTSGADALTILLSTDGGTTFSPVGSPIGNSTIWTAQMRTITSVSAFTVVRFSAASDQGLSDIGIDNVSLQNVVVCNPATNLAVSPLTATLATVSWTAAVPVPVSGYEYVLSTINTVPAGNGTDISASTLVNSPLLPSTTYYFYLRSDCGSGEYSEWTTISFTTAAQSTASLDNIFENADMLIYPNPANDYISIESSTGIDISAVKVYALTGELVAETRNESTLSFRGIAPGCYFVHIFTPAGNCTRKLTVTQ